MSMEGKTQSYQDGCTVEDTKMQKLVETKNHLSNQTRYSRFFEQCQPRNESAVTMGTAPSDQKLATPLENQSLLMLAHSQSGQEEAQTRMASHHIQPTKQFLALCRQKEAIDQELNKKQKEYSQKSQLVDQHQEPKQASYPIGLQQVSVSPTAPPLTAATVQQLLAQQQQQVPDVQLGYPANVQTSSLSSLPPQETSTTHPTDSSASGGNLRYLDSVVQPIVRRKNQNSTSKMSSFTNVACGPEEVQEIFEDFQDQPEIQPEFPPPVVNIPQQRQEPTTGGIFTTLCQQQSIPSVPSEWNVSNQAIPVQFEPETPQLPWNAGLSRLVPIQPRPLFQLDTIQQEIFNLPSTVMPPSVLVQQIMGPPPSRIAPVAASPHKKRRTSPALKPQTVLNGILKSKGLPQRLEQISYEAAPTKLQLASFGTQVILAVQQSDATQLSALLKAGLSPNPCNQFRDSIMDWVCKKGNVPMVQSFLDHGAAVRVCDGFGRTPMHNTCWAASFSEEIASAIFERDWQQLLLADKNGQTPLQYVRRELYGEWIQFIESRNFDNLEIQSPPGGLEDPANALPEHLARALSSGSVSPEKARELYEESKETSD